VFQAAIDAGAPVAPVTLRFGLADGAPTTVAAFVSDDTLVASLRRVASARGLRVAVAAHPALHPVSGASRKALARAAQSAVQGPAAGSGATSRSSMANRPVAPPAAGDALLDAACAAQGLSQSECGSFQETPRQSSGLPQ
jgi:hypothetical protein